MYTKTKFETIDILETLDCTVEILQEQYVENGIVIETLPTFLTIHTDSYGTHGVLSIHWLGGTKSFGLRGSDRERVIEIAELCLYNPWPLDDLFLDE